MVKKNLINRQQILVLKDKFYKWKLKFILKTFSTRFFLNIKKVLLTVTFQSSEVILLNFQTLNKSYKYTTPPQGLCIALLVLHKANKSKMIGMIL